MRLIFDSHLDLGWCAAHFNRDLTLEVAEINLREQGMTDEPARGHAVLSLPELRSAGVAVCVATLLARSGVEQPAVTGYKRTDLEYASQSIAYTAAHAQLAYYQLLERRGDLRILRTAAQLTAQFNEYRAEPDTTPLGVILSMEGADPILDPDDLGYWWELGLRAIGPSHYGRGRYACGTGTDGPLTDQGVTLLKRMRPIGLTLDVTHLSDTCFAQALDLYEGPLLASHHNCRALVPGDRQLTDDQITALVQRGAVIGAALDAWMLYPGWQRGVTKPQVVGLDAVADHIDHVCQLAGNAHHSALGTDLDGGYGHEQTPRDLRTYRDLHQLGDILASRGYAETDLDAIFHGNWLRFFANALPR